MVLLLTSPVTLGRLPYASVCQFPHLQNEDENSTYLKAVLSKWNCVGKALRGQSKYLINAIIISPSTFK